MAEHVSYWICSCGKSNLNNVKQCASCGKKRSKKRLYLSLAGIIIVIGFLTLFSAASDKDHTADFHQQSQTDFLSVIERAQAGVLQSPNSLQSSEILEHRNHELTRFAVVDNWSGTVRGVQRMRGKGAVSIEFSGVQVVAGVYLMLGLDTLVSNSSSELYQSLLNLRLGDRVQFSGNFVVRRGRIVELSYTDSGSLTAPEFLFKFSSVEKVESEL